MKEQEFYVGDVAYLEISADVYTEVKIIEVKRAYGHTRYEVEPVRGKGTVKVENLIKITKK